MGGKNSIEEETLQNLTEGGCRKKRRKGGNIINNNNNVTSSSVDDDNNLINVLLSLSEKTPSSPTTLNPPPQNTPLSGEAPPPGNITTENKIVDGFFCEEHERDMDGDESFSFDLVNGKPKIKLSSEMLDELRHQWKNSLIVKLLGKTITYDVLCSKTRALWKLQKDFMALDLGESYFSFTFESIEDCRHVYTQGPWVVMDHFLSVRKWEPKFKPSEARKIMKTAVWVRFHELPLEYLYRKVLYNVAKSLGMPIKVDIVTQGKYARVCIEIDLNKPLFPVIEVDGKDYAVEHESLHSFCFACSHFGHLKDVNCNTAAILIKPALKTNKFDDSSKPIEKGDLNKVKLKETEKENDNLSSMENGGKRRDDARGWTLPHSSGLLCVDKDPVLEKEVPKTKKYEVSSDPTEEIESEKEKDGLSDMENGENTNVEANGGTSPDPEIFNYPDPDFNDFGEGRVDSLEVGQIWAVYDTTDGMPRFYARISRILSKAAFKLKITWLETEPDDENELKWVNAGLPASCGNFKRGDTETSENRLMFSHQVVWEKGRNRDRFKMYPRKGETWALFKNWDMNWHSNFEPERKFEFEFVEILSDYCEDTGVSVAYLSKIKGFSCLFYRTGMDSFKIPRSQLFRFSHRVPCIRLSGEERVDVPKGSFELDPASLPVKIEEIDVPKDPKIEPKMVIISEEDSSEYEVKDKIESDSEGNSNSGEEEDDPEAYEVPESEFFNFYNEKSPEKFQPGQFWATYSNEDVLPKYYAFIRKVNKAPKFKLHASWLSACPTKFTLSYIDKRMPISCGIFKHSKGDTLSYTDTGIFSHQLIVEPTNKMDEFAIYPKTGEVWAVYKNWNSRMTPSDLKKCEYDIVEIIEVNDLSFKGVVLEMLSGHNSVFKARKHNGSLVTVQIDPTFLLKFSHKIPAFRLTGEKGGSLRGFFELDPAALPIGMFSSS